MIFNFLIGINNFSDRHLVISGLTVEAEKEVSAIDDLLTPVALFVLAYSWLLLNFFIHSFGTAFELYGVYAVLPSLLLTVLLMPASIVYDCGIMFCAYLRGVGTTTILILE